MDSNLILPTIFLIVSILYYYGLLGRRAKLDKNIKQAPVVAGRLPIIGHLHLLRGNVAFHQILAKWADKYGPVFNVHVGNRPHVIVSRWEEAKEVYTVNDKCFLSRPINSLSLYLGNNATLFGFAAFNEHWRGMRKMTNLDLLSSHRANILKNMWESEIRDGVKELYRRGTRNGAQGKGVADLNKWCMELTINLMIRLVAGKRGFTYSGEYSEAQVKVMWDALRRFVYLNSAFVQADLITGLGWSDFEGHKRSMKKTSQELGVFAKEWVDEHRRSRAAGHVKAEEDRDLIDVTLDLEEQGKLPNSYDADTIIRAMALEYLVDGSETMSSTLIWTIGSSTNRPDILKKAQEELDKVVGRDRLVEDSDSSKLLYVWAIMKESMRIAPATPLLAPREASEDCTIGGYHVAKGTILFVNAWKLMKDPRIWPDPLEFKPERFLNTSHAHMDVRGQHFQLIPFSSGRRSCPGTAFSLRIIPLTLGMLFQAFDLASPTDQPVNMSEGGKSLSLVRASEMGILLTPRLSPALYV